MATTTTTVLSSTPQKQNDISALAQLDSFRYENLFNVYQDTNSRYFYNILSKVNFPADISEAYYNVYVIPENNMPYTYLSYKLYGTIMLWWLVCAVNNIQNPVYYLTAGTTIKYLKPEYVRLIISQTSNS
jgi:hypothetical protein